MLFVLTRICTPLDSYCVTLIRSFISCVPQPSPTAPAIPQLIFQWHHLNHTYSQIFVSYWRKMLSKFDVSPWTSLSTHIFTGLPLLYIAIPYNLILSDTVSTFGQVYRWKHQLFEDNCVTLFNLPEKPEEHYEYRTQYQSIYWLAPITPSALSPLCPSTR